MTRTRAVVALGLVALLFAVVAYAGRVSVQTFETTGSTGQCFVRDTVAANGGSWTTCPGGGGQAFPVGSVFISVDATNPATTLGYGTWVAIGAGRTLVALNSGDTDFDTVEETGGAKTASHAHGVGTLLPSAHPNHAHNTSTSTNMTISVHSGTAVDAHSGTAVGNHEAATMLHQHGISTSGYATFSGTHADHSHTPGSYVAASHQHRMQDVWSHSHVIAAGQGSHGHGMAEGTTDGSGTYMDRSNAAAATTAVTDNATLPQMATNTTGSGSAWTEGIAANVNGTSDTAALSSHTLGGSTEIVTVNPSGLAHSVTQPSNHVVTQPTAHTIGGNTDGHVLAAHTMSGATASDSPSIVQPYLVVYMWKRTA